jgi:hypothetical protein
MTLGTKEVYINRRISLVDRSSSYSTQDSNSTLLLSTLVLLFYIYRDPDPPDRDLLGKSTSKPITNQYCTGTRDWPLHFEH